MILAPYGLDHSSTLPFFKKITIYQMSKGEWNSYSLINPLISAWNHDTLDYSQNAPVENNMTVIYESVQYGTGTVSRNSPQGFGGDHYDTVRSPHSLSVNNTGNIVKSPQITGASTTGQEIPTVRKEPPLTEVLGTGNKSVSAITPTVKNEIGGLKDTYFPGIQ